MQTDINLRRMVGIWMSHFDNELAEASGTLRSFKQSMAVQMENERTFQALGGGHSMKSSA